MMRQRAIAWLAETPFLFIAAVIGIAVLFRAGIGVLRAPTVEPDSSSIATTSVPSSARPRDELPTKDVPELRTTTAGEAPKPAVTAAPTARAGSRRPRTHGRR